MGRIDLQRLACLLMGVGTLLLAQRAEAVDLKSLVSPGPLIAAHQREVKECGDCHEAFDRGSQKRLCLRCHEAVAADIEAKEGFHGRLQGDRECRVCHTEHEGADAEIAGLVAESFDHGRTDFALEGAHRSVACDGCHPPERAHRDAKHECVDCHAKQDPHDGRLGKECESCHAAASWREVSFDHAKTRFPLEGLHADAACVACHPGQRFGETATQCVDCHRVDDVHRGRLGPACGDCHSPSGWKKKGFDHGKETRFALLGRHARLECRSCHSSDPKKVKLAMDCASCHRKDDDHQGLRGPKCESCHDAKAWKPSSFDHARDAKLRLEGAHAKLRCELCHVGEMHATKTPTGCVDCHAAVDVHQGSLGRDCGACHQEASFRGRVRFDHDLTDFPLLALHQLASCEDCHVTSDYGRTETACVSCHAPSDTHEGRLGPECARCHNPNGWDRWLFDHASQTRFALEGAHTNLQCVACHHSVPTRTGKGALALPTSCRGCHLGDSPHDDAYGRDCERCHVDTSWKQIEERLR
jgi:hypothetical protein